MGFKENVLNYVESNRVKEAPFGTYVYKNSDTVPLVYCSAYAALTYDLFNELSSFERGQIDEWIAAIKRYQCDDGLFRDPAFGLPDDLRDVPLDASSGWFGGIAGWGWWHMTNHIYCALNSLGAVAERPLALLESFYNETVKIEDWVKNRDWDKAWSIGNEILNLGSFLFYARDFHNQPKAGPLIERLLNTLDELQDPETGYWGKDCESTKQAKLQAMAGAYHEYILYYYEKRKINYHSKLVDATLSLQNKSGGFALDGTGGACEDIDAAFILVNAYVRNNYKRVEIKESMEKIYPEILNHQNPDGGFVYLRNKPYVYGVDMMSSGADQSSMFPTWFRTLSLALLAQILKGKEINSIPWKFNSCPYVQWFDTTLLGEDSKL